MHDGLPVGLPDRSNVGLHVYMLKSETDIMWVYFVHHVKHSFIRPKYILYSFFYSFFIKLYFLQAVSTLLNNNSDGVWFVPYGKTPLSLNIISSTMLYS